MNRQVVIALQQLELQKNLRGESKSEALVNAIEGVKTLITRVRREQERAARLITLGKKASVADAEGAALLFNAASVDDLANNHALEPRHLERKLFFELVDLGVLRSAIIPSLMHYGGDESEREMLHEYIRFLSVMMLPPVQDLATYARQSEALQRVKRTVANDHFIQFIVGSVAPLAGKRVEGDGLDEKEIKLVEMTLVFFAHLIKNCSRDTAEAVVGCMCRTQCFELLLIVLEQNHAAFLELTTESDEDENDETQNHQQEEEQQQRPEDANLDEGFLLAMGEDAYSLQQKQQHHFTNNVVFSSPRRSATGARAADNGKSSSTPQRQTPSRRSGLNQTPSRRTSAADGAAVSTPGRMTGDDNNNNEGKDDMTLHIPAQQMSPRRTTTEQMEKLDAMRSSPRKSTPMRSASNAAAGGGGGGGGAAAAAAAGENNQMLSPFRSSHSHSHSNHQQQQHQQHQPPLIPVFSPSKRLTSDSTARQSSTDGKKSESPAAAGIFASTPLRGSGSGGGAIAPPLFPAMGNRLETQLVIVDNNHDGDHHLRGDSESTTMSNNNNNNDSRDRSASVHAVHGSSGVRIVSSGTPARTSTTSSTTVPIVRTAEEQKAHDAAVDAAMRNVMEGGFDEYDEDEDVVAAEKQQEQEQNEDDLVVTQEQEQRHSSASGDDSEDDDDDDEDELEVDEDDEAEGILRARRLVDGDSSSNDEDEDDDDDNAQIVKLKSERRQARRVKELEMVRRWNFHILDIFSTAFQFAPAAALATWNGHPLVGGINKFNRSDAMERELKEQRTANARLRMETRRHQGPIASSGLIVRKITGVPNLMAPGLVTNKERQEQTDAARRAGQDDDDDEVEQIMAGFDATRTNAALSTQAPRTAYVAVGSVSAVLSSRHEDEAGRNVDKRKKQRITKATLVQPLVAIVTMPLATQKQLATQFRQFSEQGFAMLCAMVWSCIDRCVNLIGEAVKEGRADKEMSVKDSLDDLNRSSRESVGHVNDVVNFFSLAAVLLRFGRTSLNIRIKAQQQRDILLQQQAEFEQQQQEEMIDNSMATPGKMVQQQQQLQASPYERELKELEAVATNESAVAMPIVSELVTLNRLRSGFNFLDELLESRELRNDGFDPLRVAEFLAESLRMLVHAVDSELIANDGVVTAATAIASSLAFEHKHMDSIMKLVRYYTKTGRPPGNTVEPLLRLLHAKFLLLDRVSFGGVIRVPKKKMAPRKKKEEEQQQQQPHQQQASLDDPFMPQQQQQQQEQQEMMMMMEQQETLPLSSSSENNTNNSSNSNPFAQPYKYDDQQQQQQQQVGGDAEQPRAPSQQREEDPEIRRANRELVNQERMERRRAGELDVSSDSSDTDSDEDAEEDSENAASSSAAGSGKQEKKKRGGGGGGALSDQKDMHVCDFLVQITQPKQLMLFSSALENWRQLADDVVDALCFFLARMLYGPVPDLHKILFNMGMLVHIIDIQIYAREIQPQLHQLVSEIMESFFTVANSHELQLRVARSLLPLEYFEYNNHEQLGEDMAEMSAAREALAEFMRDSNSKAAVKLRKGQGVSKTNLKKQDKQRRQRSDGGGGGVDGEAGSSGNDDGDDDDDEYGAGLYDDETDILDFELSPEEAAAEKLRRKKRKEEKKQRKKDKKEKKRITKSAAEVLTHFDADDDLEDQLAAFDVGRRAQKSRELGIAAAAAASTNGAAEDEGNNNNNNNNEMSPEGGALAQSGGRDGGAVSRDNSSSSSDDEEENDAGAMTTSSSSSKKKSKHERRAEKAAKKERKREKKRDKKEQRRLAEQEKELRVQRALLGGSDGDNDDAAMRSQQPREESRVDSGAKLNEDDGGDVADHHPGSDAKQPAAVVRPLMLLDDEE